MHCLALDIGGANLKVADGLGYAAARRFPLWQRPQELADALREMIVAAPPNEWLAVTMTGELADCYQTKADGVSQILAAVLAAAGGRTVRVYRTDGRFDTVDAALSVPWLVAASNWHALACFACRCLTGTTGLLVDIGSTTTDIVPLCRPQPAALHQTDPERMLAGELVYTGVERSPVCAVVDGLPWRGRLCPTAQEVFATSADAYVVLGALAEDPGWTGTADGRPLTKEWARDRLARCICADRTTFAEADAVRAAETICRAQLARLETAARKVAGRMPTRPSTVVLSGQGEFLGRQLVVRLGWQCATVSLADQLGAHVSQAATAHALAALARESNLS